MKLNLHTTALLLFSLLFFSSCEKEYETIEDLDRRNIQDYLSANGLTSQFKQASGIYYSVVKPGTGADLDYKKEIAMIFTVRSLDGKFAALDTFAAYNRFGNYFGYTTLRGIAASDSLREAIKTALVKTGGEARLIIPSKLAYGRNGYSFFDGYSNLTLAGNSSLDVTVKVIDDLAKYEDELIKKYLGNDFINYKKTANGVFYKIIDLGTGGDVNLASTVTAEYTGRFLNGTVFEAVMSDNPTSVTLNDPKFITGWGEGLAGNINEGGTIRILIPSRLGYGLKGATDPDTGLAGVPAFYPLDFEIKVTKTE